MKNLSAHTCEEIKIQLPHLCLTAKAWGPVSGVPTLALHGWLDNAATFDLLAPLLPELRIIAIDLPGHGLSDHLPKGMTYHFIDQIPLVLSVVNFLGWDRFNLLGHSMGAGIASLVGGTDPKRIANLILIEGLGPVTIEPEKAPERVLAAYQQMQTLLDIKMPLYQSMQDAIASRKAAGDLNRYSVEILVKRGLKKVEGGLTWRSDPRLKFRSRLYISEEQIVAFLKQIEAPTLFMVGASGMALNWIKNRCEFVPNLLKCSVPGGHHLHLDNPEPVAKKIQDFLVNASSAV